MCMYMYMYIYIDTYMMYIFEYMNSSLFVLFLSTSPQPLPCQNQLQKWEVAAIGCGGSACTTQGSGPRPGCASTGSSGRGWPIRRTSCWPVMEVEKPVIPQGHGRS